MSRRLQTLTQLGRRKRLARNTTIAQVRWVGEGMGSLALKMPLHSVIGVGRRNSRFMARDLPEELENARIAIA